MREGSAYLAGCELRHLPVGRYRGGFLRSRRVFQKTLLINLAKPCKTYRGELQRGLGNTLGTWYIGIETYNRPWGIAALKKVGRAEMRSSFLPICCKFTKAPAHDVEKNAVWIFHRRYACSSFDYLSTAWMLVCLAFQNQSRFEFRLYSPAPST